MSDTLPILLAICAGALVVIGLLVLVAFGVLRRWAPQLRELLGGAGAMLADSEPEPDVTQRQTRRRPNLRQRSDPLDFDAALSRYRKDGTPPVQTQSAPPLSRSSGQPGTSAPGSRPPAVPPVQSPFDNDPPPALRRRRRRDPNQDEVFGGMLDEDGDGDLDF